MGHRQLLNRVTGMGAGGGAYGQERVSFVVVLAVSRAERTQSMSACHCSDSGGGEEEMMLSRKMEGQWPGSMMTHGRGSQAWAVGHGWTFLC